MNEQIADRLISAFEMQKKGLHGEAESAYSSILSDDPDNVHAHNLLGVICLNTGRPSEAEEHIRNALRIDPGDPETHANLALACRGMGKLSDAEKAIRTALQIEPERPSSLALLGSICLDRGSPHEAVSYLVEALRRAPPKPELLVTLSAAHCQQGQTAQAIAVARHALQMDSLLAESHLALGDGLLKACEYFDAATAFGRAAELKPDMADAWIGLGTALKEAGAETEACRILDDACERFPSVARCHFVLGTLYEQSGKAIDAANKFRDAIVASPEYGAAYFQLLQLPGSVLSESELNNLISLLDQGELHEGSAHGHFAMALCFERQERYVEAMEHYLAGHKMLGRTVRYDDLKTVKFFGELQAMLPDPGHRNGGATVEGVTPIFVVGMPRSGTTLLEQILATHPEVVGAGESSFLEDCVRHAERITGKSYPACLNLLTAAQTEELRNSYLTRLGRSAASESHIVDKTPMNFQYVGFIRRILPHARVIHCKRDALETCISIFRLPFDPSQAYAHDLQDLGLFYRRYRLLMERTEQRLPQFVCPVQLDQLIDDPETTVARICEFLGLAFNESMLKFQESERLVRTPSAMQVRQPLRRPKKSWGDCFGQAVAPLLRALEALG